MLLSLFRTNFWRYYEPESDLGGTETIHPEDPQRLRIRKSE
jgi:hypothetical protein